MFDFGVKVMPVLYTEIIYAHQTLILSNGNRFEVKIASHNRVLVR